VFLIVNHVHPSLIFADKAVAYPSAYILHSEDRLLALLANIRQGLKLLAVTNTLAYSDTELITTVKSL